MRNGGSAEGRGMRNGGSAERRGMTNGGANGVGAVSGEVEVDSAGY
jgi:hypothetical protein